MPKFTERVGFADGNTNPYYNERTYVGSGGYYKDNPRYQCVNYAIGRTCEIAEAKCCYYGEETSSECKKPLMNRKGYGNAKEWWDTTLWDKSVDNPQLGDIVVYGTSWGGGYGHVRIIEKIDNNYMYLSGANEDYKGTVKFNIKAPITIGGGSGATGLMGYIHNPFITKLKEIDYKAKYESLLADVKKIKEICDKYE